MTQARTARQELAYIERRLFKGAGLAKACKLEGEERRAYRLAQVERLLTEKNRSIPMGVYLSDMFWTAAEGRQLYEEDPGPLMTLAGQQTLTDGEMRRLRLILEIAGLCHDLCLHFTFDLKEAFGVKNDWWVSNKQLVKWLTTTEYEQIAMYTAYIMKNFANNVYADTQYLPAQDELAELFSSVYQESVRQPELTDIPPRGYVKEILDALLHIERHWQEGRKLKLEPEVVILHDEIYGVVPNQFDKGVLQAAQALYDYMDIEVYGRTTEEVMNRFAAKVIEVRDQYLSKGWVENHSLEFAYLMAHAERCGRGQWRGEDEAL